MSLLTGIALSIKLADYDMKSCELPIRVPNQVKIEWGSDVAAAMLRHVGIEFLALNPGASYRGLHDSLVNGLGNTEPKLILCLHEDHVVSIAHGYAKALDRPMGAVLHSNVGLMHGLMGIFNAYCDRMPMLVVGATGPGVIEKRRPWIDWIHTSKDQGALLRDYVKWDDEPRSCEGIIEAFLRGMQITTTEPRAPVYICLDAGLQEERTSTSIELPADRYSAAPAPIADKETIKRAVELLTNARSPLILAGRSSRSIESWNQRITLAERLHAPVLTSILERCAFPTDHPLHILPPLSSVSDPYRQLLREADVILSLDWLDLNGLLQQVSRKTDGIKGKIIHVSLDSHLHRGWSMDYFGLPPIDVPILASPERVVVQILLELGLDASQCSYARPYRQADRSQSMVGDSGSELNAQAIEVALAKLRGEHDITLAHVNLSWSGTVYDFKHPLDYLGHDGGGGLAAGPGLTVGAALALRNSGRLIVSVLGDGDFLQGATALWTAAHYKLPALFIVANNRSNFNDEVHQETIAALRGRPTENRWIGIRMEDPIVDLAALARAQGVAAEGPIHSFEALEEAILRGFTYLRNGEPYLLDVHVTSRASPKSGYVRRSSE